MGSSCSILNDTEHDVWITHGVNWTALNASFAGVFALLTGGALFLPVEAGTPLGGALVKAEGGVLMSTSALTTAGLTATKWSLAGLVTGFTASALATALNISRKEAKRIQKQVRDFQKDSELIKPGGKYTWSGSLSLTMTVYVMNDKLQLDQRACFTGPTNKSENVYPISEYFQNLDVKILPGDTFTVYTK